MRATANRVRRFLATTSCYALFGLGGVLVTLMGAPVILVSTRSRALRIRRTRRLISHCFAVFISVADRLGAFECRVVHRERLNQPGALIVANHPSLIDVVFLISLMPGATCLTKRSFWRNPVTAIPVRLAGYIDNRSAVAMVERCRAALAAGDRVILFPEGTRSVPGKTLCFQRGAAHIALAANARLVPVIVRVNVPALTRGQPWYYVPPEQFRLSMTVDEPIEASDHRLRCSAPSDVSRDGRPLHTALAARRFTTGLQRYFVARLHGADGNP